MITEVRKKTFCTLRAFTEQSLQNLWSPFLKETKGQERAHKNFARKIGIIDTETHRQYLILPIKSDQTFKPARTGILIKFSNNFRASSENSRSKTIERKPSMSERIPQDIFCGVKVLDHSPCKNKHIYGQMPTFLYTAKDTWEQDLPCRQSRLGPRW